MIELILALILIFAPIARGAVNIWAYSAIYMLILVAFLVCIFKYPTHGEVRIRRTPLYIPILLFFILSLVTIFRSSYFYGSVMEIIKFINLALIFYIVVNFIIDEKQIKKTLNLILIISTAIALFGILQYLNIVDKSWWDNPKFLSATYVNNNHFAGLMELVIPLSIGMVLIEQDAGRRSLYIYSLLILFSAFLLSMSRGGWFFLSVSIFFMSVIIIKRGKARFIFFMAILLFIVIGVFITKAVDISLLLKRLYSYGELDFEGRLEMWKGAIGIIKNNWLLGTGPGTFVYNFPKYRAGFKIGRAHV